MHLDIVPQSDRSGITFQRNFFFSFSLAAAITARGEGIRRILLFVLLLLQIRLFVFASIIPGIPRETLHQPHRHAPQPVRELHVAPHPVHPHVRVPHAVGVAVVPHLAAQDEGVAAQRGGVGGVLRRRGGGRRGRWRCGGGDAGGEGGARAGGGGWTERGKKGRGGRRGGGGELPLVAAVDTVGVVGIEFFGGALVEREAVARRRRRRACGSGSRSGGSRSGCRDGGFRRRRSGS
mmetsp:Transcript_24631/g.51120  ORF Transcript_24631/g.51120 Transcript_24631/m.51120 type:complete len:235 (-) Transcript_24631:322-1026(-)